MSTSASPPECRIPATINPGGFLRFEVSEEQAQQIFEQLQSEYDAAAADDVVSVRFVMDRDAYAVMADGLETLQDRLPSLGVKQIPLTHDPAYSFTVVVSAEQIADTLESSQDALSETGDGDMYAQEFQLSKKAAILALRQMEEAFDGAQDPVNAINIDQIRDDVA